MFRLPQAPRSIKQGYTLKRLLDNESIDCLIHNISAVYPSFDGKAFRVDVLKGLAPLGILDRGKHIAGVLRQYLPSEYKKAIGVMLASLTPPLSDTNKLGLSVFFYLPHVSFVATYGLEDFDVSMKAQYELTQRFSAEFSMRNFLIHHQERTLNVLYQWVNDPNSHVRRLCSEGVRPRLPWAISIPAFIKDPKPVLPILEALKDDEDLYVRRSVANHLGDIAKDHPDLAFKICRAWLKGASHERKWLIRHALRHPAKKGNSTAIKIRKLAASPVRRKGLMC